MKIAIHHTQHEHPLSYASHWLEALKKYSADVITLDLRAPDALDKVRSCNGVMWHYFHTPFDKQSASKILTTIENVMGIPVFPNFSTRWHFDEKIAQYYLFETLDIPKIPSWVFWNYNDAHMFLQQCTFPIIFKLSVGAGAANISKINSITEGEKILDKMFRKGFFPYSFNEYAKNPIPRKKGDFLRLVHRLKEAVRYSILGEYPSLDNYYLPEKNYVYFQQFLPNNPYDIRITVIGNRAFGFIRKNRPSDFRASGSGNIIYDHDNIPQPAIRIAHAISKKLGFQSMAYDFLKAPDGNILLNEISYGYMSCTVEQCPGYWDRTFTWHNGHLKPEDTHIEDFLYYIKHGNIP